MATEEAVPNAIQRLDPVDFYKTRDMALVSYLCLEGFTPQAVGFIERSCWWAFPSTDALLYQVDTFLQGGAMVDARGYSKFYDETMRQMRDLRAIHLPRSDRAQTPR